MINETALFRKNMFPIFSEVLQDPLKKLSGMRFSGMMMKISILPGFPAWGFPAWWRLPAWKKSGRMALPISGTSINSRNACAWINIQFFVNVNSFTLKMLRNTKNYFENRPHYCECPGSQKGLYRFPIALLPQPASCFQRTTSTPWRGWELPSEKIQENREKMAVHQKWSGRESLKKLHGF